MHGALILSAEVREAIDARKPLVALETTIVSHGMPYPKNVETARSLESIVRGAGAVPASIAVLDGAIRVGLTAGELDHLAQSQDVLKVSRSDLAFAVAQRRSGATTVAATMLCAHLAGIRVFATGGIGGVHRGGHESLDVSADLDELSRTRVCVVCAGAKALLDLPRTLEALETRGVPVVGYRTDTFPAFWSSSSGLPVTLRCENAAEIAALLRVHESLGIDNGVLVAVPVPQESEIEAERMERYIERAIAEAQREGIIGKAVTPWLINRVYELSGGESLSTNIALAQNNARVAAEIAVSL